MIHRKFESQLPIVIKVLKAHKIKSAYAFGSVVTSRFNSKSDIDLLINFEDGLEPIERGKLMWNLEFALENKLSRKFDLIQEKTPRNIYFIKELNETKLLIFSK